MATAVALPLLLAALVHHATALDASVQLLDGDDWTLTKGSAADASRSSASSSSSYPARVPGGVWDNLQRAQAVGDPLYRDNDLVFINQTSGSPSNWTLAKTFAAATPFRAGGAAVVLEFDGIQTLAAVALNGVELLSTSNMFRTYRVALPAALLKPSGNKLSVTLLPTPELPRTDYNPTCGPGLTMVGLRDESDAWGWDWSPSLNPRAIYKSVRLVAAPAGLVHAGKVVPRAALLSWSPKVSVVDYKHNTVGKAPTKFAVNASFVLFAGPRTTAVVGELLLAGDWKQSTKTKFTLPPSQVATTTTHWAIITAKVPDVKLWWPQHYGEPHLHILSAMLRFGTSGAAPTASSSKASSKAIGFRSVGLFTGGAAPASPAQVDPAHKASFVGCFRDGYT